MKRILFPVTNRTHLARQGLLLKELKKQFIVDIADLQPDPSLNLNMNEIALLTADYFNGFLSTSKMENKKEYDLVLIRGDRFEVLPLTMLAVYRQIPIAHIEGGDSSGVVDNKVRHAVSHLADYHFCTSKEAFIRLVNMGINPQVIWNFGSLDVEFAAQVKKKKIKENPYLVIAYHPIDDENEREIDKALQNFNKYEIIKIVSNKDYGRRYGEEQYSPEDYINLLRYADCCLGNSSSLLKEASILGAPVINIGERQKGRLKPKNVMDVPCFFKKIELALKFQLENGRYQQDYTYFKKDTSAKITAKLKEIL